MAKKESNERAAYCQHSKTVFEYEERDVFVGEVFCPVCASRTDHKHRYTTLTVARKAHSQARVYRS